MTTSTALKDRIFESMKDAMRSKAKERLSAIRLILAEVKRIEVDERIDVEDQRLLVVLDKMVKQRRDSITQYTAGDRQDLVAVEEAELLVIAEFMPQQLSESEIDALIKNALAEVGETGMQAMGKVMAIIKPLIQGRADAGAVSQKVKAIVTA